MQEHFPLNGLNICAPTEDSPESPTKSNPVEKPDKSIILGSGLGEGCHINMVN